MTARDFPRLAGVAEVEALSGLSRSRAGQLTKMPGFPDPVQVLAMGPVWLESEVIKFLAVPRKSGRPAREILNAHDRSQDPRRRALTEARDREDSSGC